jgi:type IV pilus biogenesis protein CpaD/CtpE
MLPVVRAVPVRLVVLALACALLAGCGRRATSNDCQLIVDKSVELQMKQMSLTDPSAIQKREQLVRSELDEQMKSCEGRRVTDRMMACVRTASSSEEIESCLR